METSNVRSIVPWKMECESKDGVIFDILFHLLAEMIRELKMWCKVESPCYQGSGSCAPGIILVNVASADERCCRSGVNVKTASHSSFRIRYD